MAHIEKNHAKESQWPYRLNTQQNLWAYRRLYILIFIGWSRRKGQGTYSLLLSIKGYLGSERIFWKPEKYLNCKNIRAFLLEGTEIFMGSLGKWTNSWMTKTSGDWELFLEASVWIKHGRGKVQADLWVSGKGSLTHHTYTPSLFWPETIVKSYTHRLWFFEKSDLLDIWLQFHIFVLSCAGRLSKAWSWKRLQVGDYLFPQHPQTRL